MPAAFVFIQEGCGACEAFMPRFQRASEPFRGAFPIGVYDLAKANFHVKHFADTMQVRATPTLIVQDRGGRLHKVEGDRPQAEIVQLLRRAL